jgi:hypothetical protein
MRKVFNKVQCLRPDRRRFLRHFGWAALAATLLPQRLLQAQQVGSVVKGQSVTLFLCGDVMTGRGIDQILPYPSDPQLYERYVSDARDYVALAERQNGPVARPVDFAYIWGDALEELQRRAPDVRIINLETAVTASDSYLLKGINYRMHPANVPCLSECSMPYSVGCRLLHVGQQSCVGLGPGRARGNTEHFIRIRNPVCRRRSYAG